MTVTIAFLRENLHTTLRPSTGVCGVAVMTSLTPYREKHVWCPLLLDNRAKGFLIASFYLNQLAPAYLELNFSRFSVEFRIFFALFNDD